MKTNNGKLSARLWAGMLMCSFIGGLAWNVENMYFTEKDVEELPVRIIGKVLYNKIRF